MENSLKARQGSKTKGTEHCISRCENFARCISRCEFLSRKGGNFAHLKTMCEIDFKVRNPLFKVRIPQMPFSHTTVQGTKLPPGTRVPFSHTSSQVSHRAKQGAKLSANLISRCENHCPKGTIFAHSNPRCEISSPRCENFAR